MVAELFLVVNDSEVVVVARAEHAVWHHLILALPAFDGPYGSSAWLETVIGHVSGLDKG